MKKWSLYKALSRLKNEDSRRTEQIKGWSISDHPHTKKGGIMKVRSIFRALCICLFVFPVVLVAQGYDIQWADTIDNGDRD